MEHGLALRTPWYVCARRGIDRFSPRAKVPALQKYDTSDFVQRLVDDPRDSVRFGCEDRWAFPVARRRPAAGQNLTLRQRLSTHELVHTPVRKLYQPNHERFYALTVELYCDIPGLPRLPPAASRQLMVGFVMRRLRTIITAKDPKDIKRLARHLSEEVLHHEFPSGTQNDPDADAAEDVSGLLAVLRSDDPHLVAFRKAHKSLLQRVSVTRVVEGWFEENGGGKWRPLPPADDQEPAAGEQVHPMWRIPPGKDTCEAAETRSLWFGVVPTFSATFDSDGRPKLDDRSTYVLQCVARHPQPPPREDCPPVEAWTDATQPFRLAAFFDPAGTSNRPVRVKLPDFKTLAAHVAEPPAGGGVQFERPAGSQLPQGTLGEFPSLDKTAAPGGDRAEICTFAIELITIVATFVLMLFMPIVIFIFRLWWMLLLKFCWPPSAEAAALLTVLANTAVKDLDEDDTFTLSGLLGAGPRQDLTEKFADADLAIVTTPALGVQLVEALQPKVQPIVTPDEPESKPDDPLCSVRPGA